MDLITLALAKKYTNKKFESAVGFQGFKVVTELPTTNISTASIYLLKLPYAESGNLYEEYIYVDGVWESLGTTISLEGYVTEEALNKALKNINWNDLQDKPFGEGVGKGALEYSGRSSTNSHLNLSDNSALYYVCFDETEVLCRVKLTSGAMDFNTNLVGVDDGYFYYSEYSSFLPDLVYSGSFSHPTASFSTVKVYKQDFAIIPIEDKYIPDTIARIADIEAVKDYTDDQIAAIPEPTWEALPDKPFYEYRGEEMGDTVLWSGQPSGGTSQGTYNGPTDYIDGAVYYIALSGTGQGQTKDIYKCICEYSSQGTTSSGIELTQIKFIYEGENKLTINYMWVGGYYDWIFSVYTNFENPSVTIYDCKMEAAPLDNKFLSDTIARIADVEALEEYHDLTLQQLEEDINDRFDDLPNDEALIQAIIAAIPSAEEVEV